MAEPEGNEREAVIMVGGISGAQREPATLGSATLVDGFHEPERDDFLSFRWMGWEGRLGFSPSGVARFLELPVLSELHDLSQRLTVAVGSRDETLPLLPGWRLLSLEIPPGIDTVKLSANRILPPRCHAGDRRNLALRVGESPVLHVDAERHRDSLVQYKNAVCNRVEMLEGKTILESTPPNLGIDLHGACNVKPPCVYCDWDVYKASEGALSAAPFTPETLRDYGRFFDNAESLTNCSIGEPFMMKDLDELLEIFADRGKLLELTTNGQILTDRNIERLLDRPVHLYISLDAATPETYAVLRNDRFQSILGNLRRLTAARGGRRFPRVFLVFMPMRVNVRELEDFVRLCADLTVDRLILRPLHEHVTNLEWRRRGYHFSYERELLPLDGLVEVSGRAAMLCRRYGVEFSNQLDFGSDALEEPPGEQEAPLLGRERLPICQQSWEYLYVLRRGVMPCCYGTEPLARMDRYRDAWNSPLLQEMRSELAAGRLHEYCRASPSCPIVQKVEHGGTLRGPPGVPRHP